MENHLETFYFLPELVDPRHQRGQPKTKKIVNILKLIQFEFLFI
jgi:hypothetical protein